MASLSVPCFKRSLPPFVAANASSSIAAKNSTRFQNVSFRSSVNCSSSSRSFGVQECTAMTGQIICVRKDGASGPKNIDFKDRVKTVGATVVKPAANATMDVAGYGTTSATSRTWAITNEGCKSVALGMNVMGLRHGIPMSIDTVVTNSRSLARMMSTSSMLGK